jgi:hypothetical protein
VPSTTAGREARGGASALARSLHRAGASDEAGAAGSLQELALVRRERQTAAAPLGDESFLRERTFEELKTHVQAIQEGVTDPWQLTDLILYARHPQMRGEPLTERPQPAFRFRDYVELERAVVASGESRRFWAERLAGFVPERLPRLPIHGAPRAGTERVRIPLSQELREGVARLARSVAVPLKSVLLAALVKALALS